MGALGEFNPDPTAAGGDVVPEFTTQVGDTYMKLKPNRDVGGEYAMWETDWVELFRGARPNGILFMLDQTDPFLQKDALNFVLQMIEDARPLLAAVLMEEQGDLVVKRRRAGLLRLLWVVSYGMQPFCNTNSPSSCKHGGEHHGRPHG
jgi:hypothetical protein